MAEEFLTLMADLDEESQARMAGWYAALREAGFRGTQTPGLPYHISLATFPLDGEREAVRLMQKISASFLKINPKSSSSNTMSTPVRASSATYPDAILRNAGSSGHGSTVLFQPSEPVIGINPSMLVQWNDQV